MNRLPHLLFLLFLGFSFVLKSQQVPFKKQIFKSSIHTPYIEQNGANVVFPAIALGSSQQLTLRFDDLANETKNYVYTFIHCNADWTQSDLFIQDYVSGYEEEAIEDYIFSINTARNYVHYSVNFPHDNMNITKSGNYMLYVFEDFDRSKPVLSIPFYVIESLAKIETLPKTPTAHDKMYTHHEIDFNIDYSLIPSGNPMQEFEVVVMQNNQMLGAHHYKQPKFVSGKKLIYDLEKQNQFEAGKEYQILDLRDVTQPGFGLAKIQYEDSNYQAMVTPSEFTAYKAYTQTYDHNGAVIYSAGNRKSPYSEGEYVWVHFGVKCARPILNGLVYIGGDGFFEALAPENKMYYRDSLGIYYAAVLLKQGIYDYHYAFLPDTSDQFILDPTTGNHSNTSNEYTILVYYQSFTANYQRLIGVKRFNFQ